MATVQFDDVKLVNLARFNFFSSGTKDETVQKILAKESLNNSDRNYLLDFLDKTKQVKPASIKTMKEEIFSIIGFVSPNSWGTVSRAEMEAIYKYVKGVQR